MYLPHRHSFAAGLGRTVAPSTVGMDLKWTLASILGAASAAPTVPSVALRNAAVPGTLMPATGWGTGAYG
eukprot:gene4762-4934_t